MRRSTGGRPLMPYTLAKALGWLVLALSLGLTIGWLLRSVAAHRQIARVRSQRVDVTELERLQARVSELEVAAAERDRLAAEHAAVGATTAARPDGGSVDDDPSVDEPPVDPPESEPSDALEEAAQVLGRPVARDDLQVIEGIGPSVEDLCVGIGIKRWADMANTEPSLLRTMLDDAGARFKMCDPSTWPRQAELLDAGRWGEFRELVDGIRDGAATT